MFKYAEMLMAEEDDKVCELIFKQQDNLILKINDRFPRIIIKKYRTLQGKVVWLWILPFVIKWLILRALCVNGWRGKSKYPDYYLLEMRYLCVWCLLYSQHYWRYSCWRRHRHTMNIVFVVIQFLFITSTRSKFR